MRAISIWVQGFCEALIRMTFPLLVLFCLLIFPAYKGLWIGYVPLLLGAVAGVWVSRFHVSLIRAVDSWSRWLTAFWLYLLPACVQVVLILVIRPEPATDGYFVFQHAELLARTGVMDPMTY